MFAPANICRRSARIPRRRHCASVLKPSFDAFARRARAQKSKLYFKHDICAARKGFFSRARGFQFGVFDCKLSRGPLRMGAILELVDARGLRHLSQGAVAPTALRRGAVLQGREVLAGDYCGWRHHKLVRQRYFRWYCHAANTISAIRPDFVRRLLLVNGCYVALSFGSPKSRREFDHGNIRMHFLRSAARPYLHTGLDCCRCRCSKNSRGGVSCATQNFPPIRSMQFPQPRERSQSAANGITTTSLTLAAICNQINVAADVECSSRLGALQTRACALLIARNICSVLAFPSCLPLYSPP